MSNRYFRKLLYFEKQKFSNTNKTNLSTPQILKPPSMSTTLDINHSSPSHIPDVCENSLVFPLLDDEV